MKRNRILSCVLAFAMVLSLTVAPALAAFADVSSTHWAVSYINDMAAKKIFNSVDDKNNFAPERTITASEVLAVCARISVETEVRKDIGEARAAQIKAIMGDEQSWFRDEYATCIEAGITSYSELKELYQSGALTKPITKEDLSFYLVRAMQLGAMAENLPTYTLDFTDKSSITPGREPYIYILNMYGIVTGNEKQAFEPKKTATRAEVCAMFSRAMDIMDKRGTNVELSEYTDYDWQAGTIVKAQMSGTETILLTIKNPFAEAMTLQVPADTPIYENSMLVSSELLKEGSYARVNLDESGKPMSVRISGSLETLTGSVVGVSDTSFLLSVNGVSQTIDYDRFTSVQVGKKTGDRSLIDQKGAYTNATCYIDRLGKLVGVSLSGGTRAEEGIIAGVETQAAGGYALTVTGFNGERTRYIVPESASITANSLVVASLTSSYRGSFVSMRVSNDSATTVSSAAVDTVTKYVQGAIKGTGKSGEVNTITIGDLVTTKSTTYNVNDNTLYYYNNVAITYGGVQKDWYVTAKLSGGEVAAMWAYPGSTITEGTISSITYPKGTTTMVVSVTKADDTVASYELDLMSQPEVKRNGKTSSLDKLVTGDSAKVTVRYNAVTLIEATPQSANVSGTITKVSQDASGVTLEVSLDDGSGTKTCYVGAGVSIIQNDKTLSMYDLKVNFHVAMVVNGDQVSSVVVDKTASSANNKISGSVILVNTKEKTITFRVEEGGQDVIYTVSAPSGTTITEAASGSGIALSKLEPGDVLDIYGTPGEARSFNAKTIIRL